MESSLREAEKVERVEQRRHMEANACKDKAGGIGREWEERRRRVARKEEEGNRQAEDRCVPHILSGPGVHGHIGVSVSALQGCGRVPSEYDVVAKPPTHQWCHREKYLSDRPSHRHETHPQNAQLDS